MIDDLPFALSFRTRRMRFEPLTLADTSDFLEIANNRVVADAVHFLHYPVRSDDITRLINDNNEQNCLIGGRVPDTGTLVAVVGMHRNESGEIEIGYLIRQDRHGEGFAKEAASGLIAALKERYPGAVITAECQPGNTVSWHILEWLGFGPVGEPGERKGRVKLRLGAGVN